MKPLLMTLAIFSSSSLSLATNYTFKESSFTLTAVVKKTNPKQDPAAAFNFSGSALVIEDADDQIPPQAQVTIRRTSYDCDEVEYNYQSEYTCVLKGTHFLQILDEVATRQGPFDESVKVLKNFFDSSIYKENFVIPIGSVGQTTDTQTTAEFFDPTATDLSVETTITTSGLTPL